MADYRVELTGRARKQYKGLDKSVRGRIDALLDVLAKDPAPAGVKKLAGQGDLLRVGLVTGE